MEFKIAKEDLGRNLRDALRSCGYFGLKGRLSSEIGYVRRLSLNQFYPRFHIYIAEEENFFRFKLHLDQKKESYQGAKAHSADYQEGAVADEAQRIMEILKKD
ncbi:MAG: hypothetical protein A2927_02585 [Candidatus Komeilibacteria bacterium RIFCSPLOWO2_01_FULL_45_10]|uniref:CYTH domain-containing protein n=1 Tax=Candidatus Komeilibacteria bacterium RIFCSPLOWO2_01_FULL_45_10 TaxID=1798550 RepID=A0A1G2BKN7_9BACT|nr:MAG: hypothetical protein A2927_02585 [Candidatus Komeilibacteria bacterium RIFCSPLOWO2_01_FULL_45_10]